MGQIDTLAWLLRVYVICPPRLLEYVFFFFKKNSEYHRKPYYYILARAVRVFVKLSDIVKFSLGTRAFCQIHLILRLLCNILGTLVRFLKIS